jgi:ADP-dependent NAD(P)H-hydrate dehydratase
MLLPQLPPRSPDSHKGDFGRALLIGGSRGMAGAIGLSGMSCLRSGAGLVTLAVPTSCQAIVAGYEPSFMTLELGEDDEGRIAIDKNRDARQRFWQVAARVTAIAVGPGLNQSAEVEGFVSDLYKKVTQPLVVDADGLNALAKRHAALDQAGGPRILTPHPGEFGRLLAAAQMPASQNSTAASNRHALEQLALQFAKRFHCIVVLKGHQTLITDGSAVLHNTTGNPGMATGGTGDVLTGIITALLCQGLAPIDAAQLGVHLHGLAGDLAAEEFGQVSLIASDLVNSLPRAFKSLENR